MFVRAWAVALVAIGVASNAVAGVVWFTDRSAWEAAVGATSFTEDFSGFATDQPFRTAPVALNGMSIQQEGNNAGFRNEIDVSPFQFTDNNGTPHASLFTEADAGTYVRLSFDALNDAFGAQSWLASIAEGAMMEVYSNGTLLGSQQLGADAGAFLGYLLTDGDAATSVRFASASVSGGAPLGEGFGLDNLAGREAAGVVPEPGTLLLLGVGLLGFGLTRTRR